MVKESVTGTALVGRIDQQQLLAHLPQALLQHMPLQVKQSYQWHRRELYQHFLEGLEGLVLAHRYNLPQQVQLYSAKLYDLVTQDMATRVGDLVQEHFDYKPRYYQHASYPLPAKFTEATRSHTYWDYQRAESFAQQVPVAALRRMQLLDRYSIQVEGYWVAEKRAYRPLPDPLLCASFGRWVVSLAMWK